MSDPAIKAKPSGYFARWAGPWRLTEVWTTGLPTDDPDTLDEHGGYSEWRWIREYDEEPHCERCKPHRQAVIGPAVTGRPAPGSQTAATTPRP